MGYLISSIRAFPHIAILLSSLLIPTAFSDDHYLNTICTKNYTVSSSTTDTYANNLHNLFSDLSNNTPTTGFGMNSSGHHYNRAFGLSLCRGDVSTNDCRACLGNASSEITTRCPHNRAAIIWYDYCLLKYSDKDFFGKIDTDNKAYLWNTNNATDPKGFNATAKGLLSNLSINATDTTNINMFARGEILFDEIKNVTIYGMAQCSLDLSRDNCKKCLDCGVKELPGFTTKTSPLGGRTLTGSCNVGYEIYPFLNN